MKELPSQYRRVVIENHRAELTDEFFSQHIAQIESDRSPVTLDRLLLVQLLQEAAIAVDRADICEVLYRLERWVSQQMAVRDADGARFLTVDNNWQLFDSAERLFVQLDDKERQLLAYTIYEKLACRLFRPNVCYYRMAEIGVRLGQTREAMQNFEKARCYEKQLFHLPRELEQMEFKTVP